MKSSSNKFWQRVFRHRPDDVLPHTITHQRIYIVPTKRGFTFLLALLLMLIAAVNYALSMGYALCFLLVGLFSATLLHTYRNLADLQIQHIYSTNVFAGSTLPFTLVLNHASAQCRQGIRISTRNGISVLSRIEPTQGSSVTLNIPTQARGVQHLGRLTLQSDWPLGLWTAWSYLHVPAQGIVFPRPEDNPPPIPSTTEESAGEQRAFGQQGDVSGLRAYVPGDSIGAIAWKSAAKGLGLQVRTFDTYNAPAKVLLNVQLTGKHQLEEQLARLCAWVLRAESTQTDYALQLSSEQLESNHGDKHQLRALTALALHGVQQ